MKEKAKVQRTLMKEGADAHIFYLSVYFLPWCMRSSFKNKMSADPYQRASWEAGVREQGQQKARKGLLFEMETWTQHYIHAFGKYQ